MKILQLLGIFLISMTATLASCSDDDKPDYMDLSIKKVDIKADGGEITLVCNSNVKYVVNHSCEWLNIQNAVTEGDATTFDIKVAPNTETEERNGRIKFIGEGIAPKSFDIRQFGFIPTGISVTSITVESNETSAKFDVLGEGAWTAVSSNPDYILTPSSGDGDTHVTITFPENTGTDDITAVITVTIDGKNYILTLTHTGVKIDGIIAEWPINQLLNDISTTWGTRELENKPGFIDAYIEPLTGSGNIRYYSCDKTGWTKLSGYACYVQTGGKGDPIFKTTLKDDYWLITGGLASGMDIPSGRKIRFEYTASITKDCCPYWIVEYLDGNEWKPAIATNDITLTASTGLSGDAVSHSETVTYNYKFEGAGIYTLVEGEFTLQNENKNVQLRLHPVGQVSTGGLYIDRLSTNCSSRFSAQHPHENGTAVKKYEQSIKIEFAD